MSNESTPTIYYQEVITKGLYKEELPSIKIEKPHEIRSKLRDRPLVFCSLQSAAYILKHKLPCYNGVFYNEKFLYYNVYSQYVPKSYLLNSKYIILPWNMLVDRINDIISLFGENIFIRPNSPNKPFTGFAKTGKDELLFEINALTQTDNVYPHELCIVAPAKEVPDIEWRFWLVDEKVSTYAPYSWNELALKNAIENNIKPPQKMIEAAGKLARGLVEHDNAIVADFIMLDDHPKVVELNAVSTSGWYQGMDYIKLCNDLTKLF